MICTLRDELAQRCVEIIDLETTLSCLTQQVTSPKLKRNTSIFSLM